MLPLPLVTGTRIFASAGRSSADRVAAGLGAPSPLLLDLALEGTALDAAGLASPLPAPEQAVVNSRTSRAGAVV
ncbi:hypothetical protein C6376_09650 [Streptomyces sp. P3]|nr:hypothetical protein C6376_09650 [Streptomyces sp. P3]